MGLTQKIKEKWNFTSPDKKTILTRIIGAVTLDTLGFSILLNVGQHREVVELTENQTELEKEVIHYQLENEELVNDLVAANDSYISLSKESEQLVSNTDELEMKIEELESKLEEKKDKNEQLKNDKSNLETELKKEKDKNSNFNDEMDGSDEPKVSGEIVESSGSGASGDKRTMVVTWFTANAESTGKSKGHPAYGITASGAIVSQGTTLACPPSMEFGTQVYIPKFDNTYTCQDRGADIVEGRLDVYIDSVSEARKLGMQSLEVVIK
ncbi:3D domain-containing protein [Alkalihalobacillus sp. NPDC078783]